jgi:hypothetical protein
MVDDHAGSLPRRTLLAGALLGAVSACKTSTRSDDEAAGQPSPSPTGGTMLLAYFSRAGENYWNGGRRRLTVGNTQVVAETIGRLTGCDVHRIEAADPYPDDYDPTVARNVREQEADARPAIANPLTSIERYDTVLLGSPI